MPIVIRVQMVEGRLLSANLANNTCQQMLHIIYTFFTQTCSLGFFDNRCRGGHALKALNGFWRSSNMSTNFTECFFKASCEGASWEDSTKDLSLKIEHNESCKYGYQGRLCHSCIEGWGKLDQPIASCNYKRTFSFTSSDRSLFLSNKKHYRSYDLRYVSSLSSQTSKYGINRRRYLGGAVHDGRVHHLFHKIFRR